jgi:ABC-type lipoprotein export system ATPase subunit
MLRVKSLLLPNNVSVTFDVNLGEGIVIKGSNGSGKSLFLKSLARLYLCTYKIFEYNETEIINMDHQQYRSEVLYVSPSPLLLQDQSVEDFFLSVLNLDVYKDHIFSFDYLKYLNAWSIGPKQPMSLLSSGQRQLVSILRALSLRAKILLLDEPTANLDREKTLEVEKLFADWRSKERSIILISHSEDQSQRLGWKIIHFRSLMT